MKQVLNNRKILVTTLTLLVLTACGGGGGGDSDSDSSTTSGDITKVALEEDKTFTINASSIVIKHIDSSAPIPVDISGIESDLMTVKITVSE